MVQCISESSSNSCSSWCSIIRLRSISSVVVLGTVKVVLIFAAAATAAVALIVVVHVVVVVVVVGGVATAVVVGGVVVVGGEPEAVAAIYCIYVNNVDLGFNTTFTTFRLNCR